MTTELTIVTTYGRFPVPRGTDIGIQNFRLVPRTDPQTGEDTSFTIGDIVFTTDSRIYTLVGITNPYEFYWEHLEDLERYFCPKEDAEGDPCLWDEEDTYEELYVDAFNPEYHFEELIMEDRPPQQRILCNKIRCLTCGETVESRSLHDYVQCACGACAVDSGHYYIKRICNSFDCYEELSVIQTV